MNVIINGARLHSFTDCPRLIIVMSLFLLIDQVFNFILIFTV